MTCGELLPSLFSGRHTSAGESEQFGWTESDAHTLASPQYTSAVAMLTMQISCYLIAAVVNFLGDEQNCMSERLYIHYAFDKNAQYQSHSYEGFWLAIASTYCMGPGCWDMGDQWVWETSEGRNGLCLDYFSLDKVDRISQMSSKSTPSSK
jgi:hypothetical protein